MSDTASNVGIPGWEMRHRLTRSLEAAKMRPEEMAEYLGMHPNSIYGYLRGRMPRTAVLRLWALRTGVPYEWLLTGDVAVNGPDGGGSMPPRKGMPWCVRSPLVRVAA